MKIILVLGNKLLPNGKITKILKDRLNSGIDKYEKNDIFLVSGGNTSKLHSNGIYHTEAYMMKKYILGKLPYARVLTESKSISTNENIKYCAKILKDYTIKVVLISSPNHLKRINKIINDSLTWEITS